MITKDMFLFPVFELLELFCVTVELVLYLYYDCSFTKISFVSIIYVSSLFGGFPTGILTLQTHTQLLDDFFLVTLLSKKVW